MAFEQISSANIEAGDPVTQELWSKTKNSFDDHESRITDLEAGILALPPIEFIVKGDVNSFSAPLTALAYKRLFQNITLTSARLFIVDDGASGTLDIDIQYKRGVAAFASIFSTRPSVAAGSGDFTISTNAVISTDTLLAGDILRLDTATHMVGCTEFHVYLTFQVTT